MATWGPPQPKKNVTQKGKRSVKLYITTYTDEFDTERDFLGKEVTGNQCVLFSLKIVFLYSIHNHVQLKFLKIELV